MGPKKDPDPKQASSLHPAKTDHKATSQMVARSKARRWETPCSPSSGPFGSKSMHTCLHVCCFSLRRDQTATIIFKSIIFKKKCLWFQMPPERPKRAIRPPQPWSPEPIRGVGRGRGRGRSHPPQPPPPPTPGRGRGGRGRGRPVAQPPPVAPPYPPNLALALPPELQRMVGRRQVMFFSGKHVFKQLHF